MTPMGRTRAFQQGNEHTFSPTNEGSMNKYIVLDNAVLGVLRTAREVSLMYADAISVSATTHHRVGDSIAMPIKRLDGKWMLNRDRIRPATIEDFGRFHTVPPSPDYASYIMTQEEAASLGLTYGNLAGGTTE